MRAGRIASAAIVLLTLVSGCRTRPLTLRCTGGDCATSAMCAGGCSAPPAASCEGDVLVAFDAEGSCTPSGCVYASREITCAGCPGCDPCASVVCSTPPGPTCVDGRTLRTYAPAGACTDGGCNYPTSDSTCVVRCAGDRCVGMVSAGVYYTCGVQASGAISCWGGDVAGIPPPSGTFSSVSAAFAYACGVRADSTIVCWGQPIPPPANAPYTSVSGGTDAHICGLRSDGTVDCVGSDVTGAVSVPAGSTFSSVSAGDGYTCGVQTDGTLLCWGFGTEQTGETTPPAGTFLSVSTSTYESCGVRTDGSVACWGNDDEAFFSPPPGTFLSVSAADDFVCALRADSTIACWGNDYYHQSSPPPGAFLSVSANTDHACGIRVDGSVACWGMNYSGESSPPAGPF